MGYEFGIVILNYDTYELTIDCIQSIFEAEKNDNWHIYLVDNGSTNNSQVELAKNYENNPYISLCFSKANLGFSKGMNIGAKKALEDDCKIVFFLNNDLLMTDNALSEMAKCLDNNDDVVASGPLIYDINRKLSTPTKHLVTLKSYLVIKRFIPRKIWIKYINTPIIINEPDQDVIFSDGMVQGCCFGLKASFLSSIGFLDPTTFLYSEEDILAYQIRNINKKVAIACRSKVIHVGSATTSKVGNNSFMLMYMWPSVLYVLKSYAQTSVFACYVLAFIHIIEYGLAGMVFKDYRKRFKFMISETFRLLKAERYCPLDYLG